ncbi:MAG TPA: DUF6600 domain-containing protein [Thermoanaerobaculia bacterium]|nr:DUF6600 domain-containing protein [Thermoanaerobaculia bacterium]
MRITKLALFLLVGTLVGSRMATSEPSDRQGDGRGDPRAGDRRDGGRDEPQAGDRRDGAEQGDAGSRYFHQRLSPYGRWGTHGSYGEVWRPRVAAGWRPYTTGHWVYTDYGWTWAADESWGWAPFHYGRWYQDSLGWGWVPGNVWAPAWVDWRNGGGYVGWAALPPEAGFTVGVGVNFGGFDLNAALVPSYFCFVPERSMLEPRLGTFLVSPTRNVEILRGTSNLNGIAMVNGRVFNQGMSVQRMEQLRGSPVPRVQVANQAAFYRPVAVVNAARQMKNESFVNRPAPRAAAAATSAAARPVPAGGRSASRQAPGTQSAKVHAAPGANARGQSRSATLPNQGQNGHGAVSRTRAQRASSKHATTPPTQAHDSGATAARSHAAPVNPPQHRAAPQAAAGSNPPPRRAASANPPPRHVAAATQHPAHATAQARTRQQPPPASKGQPQGQ